jgi:hypothetical protein
VIIAVFLLGINCTIAAGGTIYVDATQNGDGSSWADAYKYLQDALTSASSGDEIRVAEGVYKPDQGSGITPGDQTATFQLINGVTLNGGYAGNGEPDPDVRDINVYETVLSGDLNGNDGPNFANNDENSFHVVNASNTNGTAVLDGVTIIGGNTGGDGGGIYNYQGSPSLNNCTLSGNSAGSKGGGMYTCESSPKLTNCIFNRNQAVFGGGIFNHDSNPNFTNCKFTGNLASSLGGGIRNYRSSPTVRNCVFSGNSAGDKGGGMYSNFNCNPTLTNCTFYGNTAVNYGGGICNWIIGYALTLNNCIIWNNTDSGGMDQSAQVHNYLSTLVVSYCCINGWTGGTGNIDVDPLFMDTNGIDNVIGTADDNFLLLPGSPCIDAGNNDAVPGDVVNDIDGNPRFCDDPDTNDTGNGTPPIVDMGVCEYKPNPRIDVSPVELEFWALEGGLDPNSQTLSIRNIGGGILQWDISETCTWLEAVPSSGTSAGEVNEVTINVDISGLPLGHYNCVVTISDSNAVNTPYTMNVLLHIVEITPSVFWKNQIVFPDDPFLQDGFSTSDPSWVKFTMLLLGPYDPNTVYFQDSQEYIFHYDFATELLDPFIGMSMADYYDVTLYELNQEAVLGAVIMPPVVGSPPSPEFEEYGIQFIRDDAYSKEEIADMFSVVKGNIFAEPSVEAFYFPSYEQLAVAEVNRDWFESQGVPVGSAAHWAKGNICYSAGWAMGELKYFSGDQIQAAYLNGDLLPDDILLTDGVPAEIPFVAGILSLSPSTSNSHVAILARTFGVPFAYLAIAEDANSAQQLVEYTVLLRVAKNGSGSSVGLLDIEGLLTQEEIDAILALKEPMELDIEPTVPYGGYSADTNSLLPEDINNFGGKASNFGILRTSIPNNSPVAVAFSFDLWNEFLDQSLVPCGNVIIKPGGYLLFWADDDQVQGPTHTSFKLSASGEYVGLYDTDGVTLIDEMTFGPQGDDISYGRESDGNDNWVFFSGGTASPNQPNSGDGGPTEGLFINEFMADNDTTIADANGEYDDWIEIYNAGSTAINLSGMYLTDDASDPTKWMIPVGISGSTLREEIANRLAGYTYPPSNMAALSADLAIIRSIITNASVTSFSQQLKDAVIAVLQNPNYGFDVNQKIRFRSSTNVEDSEQFVGAGLYDSYSGCLADELDGDDNGPCICDTSKSSERGVFRAIRKVFASFYNDNAFLERLCYDVNEAEVGMAVLVHHSFPDEFELANGVATLERKESDPNTYITLVTQDGAVSVANPEVGPIPEEVSVVCVSESEIYLTLIRQSNLVILGEAVMEWEADYNDLTQLLVAAAEKFEEVTGKTEYIFDFEYKKVADGGAALPVGGLVVKQVREIPRTENVPSTTPFLINEPKEYCIERGYGINNLFTRHRLKSRWTLETKNLWLTAENLAEGFYSNAQIEYAADGRVRTLTGKLPLLPFANHTFAGTEAIDSWFMHHLSNPRTYELQTDSVRTQVGEGASPVVTLADFGGTWNDFVLFVEYAQPVPTYGGGTLTESTVLCSCPEPQLSDIWQQRTFVGSGGSITTTFYWEAGFGNNLISRFVETTIVGYTSSPIVLNGYYSQSYAASHHNWYDSFLFEPQLEPGISQAILDELRASNIRLFLGDDASGTITTYGFEDGIFIPGDFEPDGDVDFVDFAKFAIRWLETGCDACGKADLTGDGEVDQKDLKGLTDNWLAGVVN